MKKFTLLCILPITLACGHCQSWDKFWIATLDLDRTEISLLFGVKDQLQVTSTDAGSDFVWSVSDPTKVSVSANGELRALKTGTVIVTVKTRDERRIGQAFVTVPRSQMLSIRGAVTTEAMLFNPLASTFSALPALPATAGNGAGFCLPTIGPLAGKILIIHGNASNVTSVFDPATLSFSH